MASKILQDSVSSLDDGQTWDFQCPGIAGNPCGDPRTGAFFSSIGWPTKKVALARGQEHFDEHKAAPELQRLRVEVALAANNAPGFEKVKPEAKQAEHDDLLAAARMSSLEEFRDKHGLVVNTDTGLADLVDVGEL